MIDVSRFTLLGIFTLLGMMCDHRAAEIAARRRVDGSYRLLRTHAGLTSFARVSVTLEPADDLKIDVSQVDTRFWIRAVEAGVRYALAVARTAAHVRLRELTGTHVDTTAAAVAIAGARAVWNALGFVVPDDIEAKLELALADRTMGPDRVPEFMS